MTKMEKIKKALKEHKKEVLLTAAIVTYFGLVVGECILTSRMESNDVADAIEVDDDPFDILRTDSKITGAFATVQYEDDTIGVISIDSPEVLNYIYESMFPGD